METKPINDFFQIKDGNPKSKEEPEKILINSVPGLRLIKNFITKAEESSLISDIDKQPWANTLKRRTQQYGYEYDYTSRGLAKPLGEFPDFISFVKKRIMEQELMSEEPLQCLVNEYEPGQGISPHIDSDAFGEEVISISLGSDVVMDFIDTENKKVSVMLPRRSLVLLEGDTRRKWKHGIAGRKKDQLEDGIVLVRKRRVSLTFRIVIKKASYFDKMFSISRNKTF